MVAQPHHAPPDDRDAIPFDPRSTYNPGLIFALHRAITDSEAAHVSYSERETWILHRLIELADLTVETKDLWLKRIYRGHPRATAQGERPRVEEIE